MHVERHLELPVPGRENKGAIVRRKFGTGGIAGRKVEKAKVGGYYAGYTLVMRRNHHEDASEDASPSKGN
jgi:hypothetical protein